MAGDLWSVDEQRPNLFPADAGAERALEKLAKKGKANLGAVLDAARAAGVSVDAYSYVCSSALLARLGGPQEGCLKRLILRYPQGFDATVADGLPKKSKAVRVVEPPEPVTAHAKLYLLHLTPSSVLAISGSSNATWHGFQRNVECNTAVLLGRGKRHPADPREIFERLWNESEPWDAEKFRPAPLVDSQAPPLLPYQREAIAALNEHLLPHVMGQRRDDGSGPDVPGAMVSLPTGAGKTVLAVRWLLENVMPPEVGKEQEYRKVLWLTHTGDLLEQAYTTFKRQLNKDLEDVGGAPEAKRLLPMDRELRPLMKATDIVFATRQLVANRCGRPKAWPYFDLIVIDEAHHACGTTEQYPSILEEIPHGALLGITATPWRTAPEEDLDLYEYFRPTGSGATKRKPLYHRTLKQLEHINVKGRRVFARMIPEKVDTGWTLNLKSIGTEQELREKPRFETTKRVRKIAAHYDASRHFPALFFAVNIADANALTKALLKRGVKAQAVHSGEVIGCIYGPQRFLSPTERREVVEQLRRADRKHLEVIVSVDMFIEGLDVPQLNSVFLARPTFSSRVFLQMRGRGLRGPAVGGTATCHIVSCRDKVTNETSENQLMDNNRAESQEAPRSGRRTPESDSPGVVTVEGMLADQPLDNQAILVFDALLYRGWLSKDEAVRKAAENLRDSGRLSFKRLRCDGHTYALVATALNRAGRLGFVEAKRGKRRAVKLDRDEYDVGDWAICVIKTLDDDPGPWTMKDLARSSAEWASARLGLQFERMSRGLAQPIEDTISTLQEGGVITEGYDGLSRARYWKRKFVTVTGLHPTYLDR